MNVNAPPLNMPVAGVSASSTRIGLRLGSSWRTWLRLTSALTMLTFVICHLTAHCFLLISFDAAETARRILMYPWGGWTGTIVLSTAFLIHYTNALWSIY